MASEARVYKADMGEGGDELRLEVSELGSVRLQGVGCPELLRTMIEWRPRLKGPPSAWPIPTGDGHAIMLVREVVLRARGEWTMPLEGEGLCRCRAVPQREVDLAILRGARTIAAVGAATGAGTQCGTCRPDIANAIRARTS